jgi:hypothetical protein
MFAPPGRTTRSRCGTRRAAGSAPRRAPPATRPTRTRAARAHRPSAPSASWSPGGPAEPPGGPPRKASCPRPRAGRPSGPSRPARGRSPGRRPRRPAPGAGGGRPRRPSHRGGAPAARTRPRRGGRRTARAAPRRPVPRPRWPAEPESRSPACPPSIFLLPPAGVLIRSFRAPNRTYGAPAFGLKSLREVETLLREVRDEVGQPIAVLGPRGCGRPGPGDVGLAFAVIEPPTAGP